MLSDSIRRLNITFADEQTRSSWKDNTDAEGKVSYVCENSDNMLTAIKHGSQYVPFYETLSSAATYHSKTKFETVDDAKSKIKLQTVSGVKYDFNSENNQYLYSVSVGDNMYLCHPINEDNAAEYKATINSSSCCASDFFLPRHSPTIISSTTSAHGRTIPTYIPPPH